MAFPPEGEMPLSSRYWVLPSYPDGETELSCPVCDEELEIHQPDADLPDRLLATCGHCKTWYLIDVEAEESEGEVVLIQLPGPDQLGDKPELLTPS